MYCKRVATKTLTLLLVLAWAICASTAFAQRSSNSGSNNDDDNRNSTYSGVMIDVNGVLSRDPSLDSGMLRQRQLVAARASYSHLPKNVRMKSPMRYVSLNRMEKTLVSANGVLTEEMRYLAGLQRIRYVFYFEDSKDIVLAGPAEGWFPGYEGAMIGEESGLPVCELQDLVVALRAFAPGKEGADVVGCSIDPTEEGNARMQQFAESMQGMNPAIPAVREKFVTGLRKSMGMQVIRVDGIPATTHAAHVIVAADYRMKRIGIGIDPVPNDIRMKTFISEVTSKSAGGNSLFRWFFVPDYQSVIMTEDRSGMELTGAGVKLVAEDEIVSVTGERSAKKGKVDTASRAYAKSFTEVYPKLARRQLVFAQLRNVVDMLICAAHIQKEDFYGKSGWTMEFLGSEEKYPVQVYSAPTQVEALVGQKFSGNRFMAPTGGVEIEPELALSKENVKIEENARITDVRNKVKIELQDNQWWWD